MTPTLSDIPPLVGVDIGGTRIKVGVADANHRVLARASGPTPAGHAPSLVVQAVVDLVREALRQASIDPKALASVGVGVPGRVEPASGTVLGAANLTGWRGVPLGQLISEALGVPVAVHNDANAAAFGEFVVGRGTSPAQQSVALLTLGTGVGGGVVLGGRLVTGANQMAGEIGHVVVEPGGLPCPCGQVGCLERYAAAPAIIQAYRDGRSSPEQILRAADTGDADAAGVLDRAARYLAIACIDLIRLLDLDTIYIGGGLADAGEGLVARIRAAFTQLNWSIPTDPPRFVRAALGNDAGWLGAAALAAELAPAADEALAVTGRFTESA